MKTEELERSGRRKILFSCAILIVLAVVLGVSGFLQQREADCRAGDAHGYTTGFSIGYTDYLNGIRQDAQKLAGEIVPYETGTAKWKYFIMGFDRGYSEGLSGDLTWNTNES